MRKSCFLMMMFCFYLFLGGSSTVFAQANDDQLIRSIYEEQTGRKISINVRRRSLDELLKFIGGKAGVNIIVDKEIRAKVTIRLVNEHWKIALKTIADEAKCVVEQLSPTLFRVTKPPTVSMEFSNADLGAVLDLLARQAGSNIIISQNIKGKVTLNLRDVHWKQALKTIVKTSGFVAVEEDGKIIRIVTRSSLKDQLETEILSLKYVRPPGIFQATITSSGASKSGGVFFVGATTPTTAGTFTLHTALNDAVDESIGEKVIYDSLSNSFVVRATKPTINRLRRIIKKIDVEPTQVFIDVKFVKTSSVSLFERGIRFSDPDVANDGILARAVFGSTLSAGTSVVPVGELKPGSTGLLSTDRGLFPFELGDQNTFSRRFRVPGVLDFTQITAMLRLVKTKKNIRIIQSPSLMTLNHKAATIFVGENIPFAEQKTTPDPNGGPSVVTLSAGKGSPISVGFHLYITPHIIPETNKIMMNVIPKSNILSGPNGGFKTFDVAGQVISLPQTQEQIVVTNLMVEDGKTAIIGGLLSETKTEFVSKIPFLSSIPLLGGLFTYKSMNTSLDNLVIFITPTILQNTEQMRTVSRRKIIDFGKLDYFRAKARNETVDGNFKKAPTSKNSYQALLSNLYKEEQSLLDNAEKNYKKVIVKVEASIKENKFDDARKALEGYPLNYRISTKFGKLIAKQILKLEKAEKLYELEKKRKRKAEEEEEE